ncbi:hypothetical protein [Tellurirhabdus rosea]|uniref:hypothetical protein n=1 Tax=Tellurirhabdus rosea TaxID=2674997 RepID=UPI00224DF257|nr:hypothetical protein [Tellurirhabdus rosea]
MNPTATQLFWSYFEPIAQATPGVNKVLLSDGDRMDRLVADSRSEDLYPVVFLLRPRWTGREMGGMDVAAFDVRFFVFVEASMAEDADQDRAYDDAERIASDIIRTIREGGRVYESVFDFDSLSIDPVRFVGMDTVWGVECRCKIGLAVNEIFNS